MPDEPRNDDVGGAVDAEPPSKVDRPPESTAPDADSLLALLADERRRRLLSYLTDRSDASVPLEDLREAVIAPERPEPGPVSHRERVAIDLHHVHLPMLADAGVIEYDPVDGTVRYVGPAMLDDLLETVGTIDEEP